MGEKTISCPKCGSEDLIEWGSDRRMCRRCHEVFSASEVLEGKTAEKTLEYYMPRIRETYVESDEEADEDIELRSGLTLASKTEERLEETIEKYSPQLEEEIDDLEEASVIFEREHAERKKAQEEARREREAQYQATTRRTQTSYPAQPAPQQAAAKKKKARAAVGWVIFFVMIWVIITIICSVREC